MPSEVQIKCRNIWKIFGDNPKRFMKRHKGAHVSFDVHAGEILIIMGLSGSGKSTLVRCITRLNDPTHKMGMVFQSFGLLPNRDVLENVAFPLEVQGMEKAERVQRAKDMIELVGLQGRESYFPRELSGGQQQRVGIARSLAVEPDIWFLDEPFSALDPLIRAEMQDEFMRLQQKLKKTIVFITHDFEEATKLADRIGIMKDGRMVQLDTPEQIVLNPADDYVAEFARNAPRERIVSVGTIMKPIDPSAEGTVSVSAKIGSVAQQVLTANSPMSVTREDVATTIFSRDAA